MVGGRPVQASESVGAAGIDAGAEEQVGMSFRQRGDEFVRYVELGARSVQVSPVIHRAIQRSGSGGRLGLRTRATQPPKGSSSIAPNIGATRRR